MLSVKLFLSSDVTVALNGFVVNENKTAEGLKRESTCESDIKITTIGRFCLQLHVASGLIPTHSHTPAKQVGESRGAGRLLGSDRERYVLSDMSVLTYTFIL